VGSWEHHNLKLNACWSPGMYCVLNRVSY